MFTRKKLFITALILIICVWTLINFASPKSEAAGPQPVKGGILKAIRGNFPKVLGYPPEQGPTDTIFALLYAERLSEWDEKGNLIPVLAESWEGDPKNKTVTFHLRKGVKFHDGTPFNAEAARWNFQLRLDTKSQIDGDLIKSGEAPDDYTVRLNCTDITTWSPYIYGWGQHISPTAYEKNGGKEWARFNSVGVGPYKVVEFKRDNLLRFEKNKDYWRKGYPLLDGIEIRCVPDPVTASMMM